MMNSGRREAAQKPLNARPKAEQTGGVRGGGSPPAQKIVEFWPALQLYSCNLVSKLVSNSGGVGRREAAQIPPINPLFNPL